jgi:hypothetical protein
MSIAQQAVFVRAGHELAGATGIRLVAFNKKGDPMGRPLRAWNQVWFR